MAYFFGFCLLFSMDKLYNSKHFFFFFSRPLEQIYKKILEKYLEFGHEKEQQYPQRTGINRKNTEKIKTWGIKNGIIGHTIFVLR